MSMFKENIYNLEERSELDISPLWQVVQITFYIVCIGCCIFGSTSFGHVLAKMKLNCILYSNMSFEDVTGTYPTGEHHINLVKSTFYNGYCDLVLYVPILISIFAFFFMVMFVYCGRGGAGNHNVPSSWRIVMPTIIFNAICFVSTFAVGAIFHGGLSEFLHSVSRAWEKSKLNLSEITKLYIDNQNIGPALIYHLSVTKHCMWMLTTFWGLSFFWILLRCLFNVDFQLVRTTIHVIPKSQTIFPKSIQRQEEEPKEPFPQTRPVHPDPDSTDLGDEANQRTVHFSPNVVTRFKGTSTEISPSFARLESEDLQEEENEEETDWMKTATTPSLFTRYSKTTPTKTISFPDLEPKEETQKTSEDEQEEGIDERDTVKNVSITYLKPLKLSKDGEEEATFKNKTQTVSFSALNSRKEPSEGKEAADDKKIATGFFAGLKKSVASVFHSEHQNDNQEAPEEETFTGEKQTATDSAVDPQPKEEPKSDEEKRPDHEDDKDKRRKHTANHGKNNN